MGLLGCNQGGMGYFPSKGSMGESLSVHFPASRHGLLSIAAGSLSHLQSQQCSISLTTYLLSHLFLSPRLEKFSTVEDSCG